MTKTISLYLDFEFTSLSPDAQPISLGIVSDCDKSFYSEFSDFDINRCDDWVKENVVEKLHLGERGNNTVGFHPDNSITVYGDTEMIKSELKSFLLQFFDYQIQFVCDCGTYDWYWMVQLLAEWETKSICFYNYSENKETSTCSVKEYKNSKLCPQKKFFKGVDFFNDFTCNLLLELRTGLPKLPANISPVPEDLNDLIARNKGISVREAFNVNRESIGCKGVWLIPEDEVPEGISNKEFINNLNDGLVVIPSDSLIKHIVPNGNKHNALWDAKVIKEIYQKLE